MKLRRLVPFIGASLLAVAMIAPASAHFVEVDGEIKAWAGGPAGLNENGKGLVLGGESGDELMAPAHVKGLNTACAILRENGKAAVDIYGPPPKFAVPNSGCAHGAVDVPEE